MNGHFFFHLDKKMSDSQSCAETGVDAHATYLFERDKNFKQKYDAANKTKRIVPEVSGKKRLSAVLTLPETHAEKSVEKEGDINVVQESMPVNDKDGSMSILAYLQKEHSNMTMEEKVSCIEFLNDGNKTSHYYTFLLIVITFVIGLCIGKTLCTQKEQF
jgi:hypothetical protein